MKTSFFKITLCLISLTLCIHCKPNTESNLPKMNSTAETISKVLRHVVLFKFTPEATPKQIDGVIKAFEALPEQIKEIKAFEWGLNNSPESLNKGFTHCFFLTFDSEQDRATYLPHPKHKEFGALVTPVLDDVLVVDYWTTN